MTLEELEAQMEAEEIEDKRKGKFLYYRIFKFIKVNIYYPIYRFFNGHGFDWREVKFAWQRLTRGWDDKATWHIGYYMYTTMIPMLKRFKELNNGHPAHLTEQEWDNIIDKIILGFEAMKEQDDIFIPDDNNTQEKERWDQLEKNYREGMSLFREYLGHIWW